MKNMKNLLLMSCLIFCLSGCQDWLTIQPETQVTKEDMFKTQGGFYDALIGCYTLMRDNYSPDASMVVGGVEYMANLWITATDGGTAYDFASHDYRADLVEMNLSQLFLKQYEIIANVNTLLEYIDIQNNVLTEDEEDLYKGETLGLRAFIHFDLLRLFGWGNLKERPDMLNRLCIPYAFHYTKEIVPQVTVGTALEYMEKDLTEAEKLISHDVATSRFTFNYYALLATRMRIAMWKGDYSVARKYAENLLNYETDFAWVSRNALETSYPENRDLTFSSEYLFGLSIEQYKDITDSNLEFKLVENQDNPQMFFHTAEIAAQLFEVEENIGSGDYRYKWLYAQGGDRFAFLKLKQYEKSIYGNRVPLMKKAEIYYTLAECLNESGNESERQAGVGYLNTVRSKRNIPQALDVNMSKDELREEIQKEWRKEMLLEGQMFYYYKRRGISSIPRCNITMTDQTYVLPLPQAELEFGGRENNK